MALIVPPRNYSMSDADLCMFTSNLCLMLTDDLIPLGLFGLTALKISALEALGDAFEVYPSDDSLRGLVEIATRTKDEKAELVRQLIRDMSARMEMKFGAQSAEWNRLGVLNMNNFTDKDLLFAGRRVQTVCTEYLTSLADFGLTQIILDNMEVVCQAFETALNAQMDAISNRQMATKDRVDKGNEIYTLVSLYCDMGKRYWFDKNPVKYNQYIIYSSPSPGSMDAPAGLNFNISNMTINWQPVENAVSYIAELSTDGGASFSEIFSGSDTHFIYEPTFEGTVQVRVKGHSSIGNGPSSTLTFTFYSILPEPSDLAINLISGSSTMFELTWNPVLSAASYKIYKSEVAIGNPAGEYTYVTDVTGTVYSGTAVSGKRNWFVVKASNATQMSSYSEAVYLDVTGTV